MKIALIAIGAVLLIAGIVWVLAVGLGRLLDAFDIVDD